jgi:hypothetical protein
VRYLESLSEPERGVAGAVRWWVVGLDIGDWRLLLDTTGANG